MIRSLIACFVLALVTISHADAQTPPATPVPIPIAPVSVIREPDRVVVRAIRLTEPLHLDGQLDEAVYRDNMPIDGFVQQEPREGQPATEGTDA